MKLKFNEVGNVGVGAKHTDWLDLTQWSKSSQSLSFHWFSWHVITPLMSAAFSVCTGYCLFGRCRALWALLFWWKYFTVNGKLSNISEVYI